MRQFGAEGQRLWRLARGIDNRPVEPDRGAKSISNEVTFEHDIRDLPTLERILWNLSDKVSARLKECRSMRFDRDAELKTADFRQRTRAQTIHAPTQLAARIFAISRELLAEEIDGTAFRLIGTGVSALQPGSAAADDVDLLDRRYARAERAIDDLRKSSATPPVIRGIAYQEPEKPPTPTRSAQRAVLR
ncbi:MAG: hypothetical protein MZV49_23805 [Rhodopseudomonas palustris]|nr:hypothetical protein [Rhodopseudomonas palustris]